MDIYNNEGKSDVIFRDYKCKEALYQLKRKELPYSFDLNIYRGCSHNCQYCYARKSHKYLNSKGFENEIFVKTNIAEVLEKELKKGRAGGKFINIGGVCDSYQPAERKFKLMPDILKILIKYKQPVIISTKSNLILRDIELIDQLAHYAWVNIAVTITSDNDEISSKVEPGASLPGARWNILQEFSKAKASTGFHFFPILPFLSDDKTSMEKMVKRASEVKVDYMLSGVLYLSGGIKERYLSFIKREFPEYYFAYVKLYPRGRANPDYKSKIHSFLGRMREKYGVNAQYSKIIPPFR
ncbi:hypothetical protein ES708_31404 [subsurface metagenome]